MVTVVTGGSGYVGANLVKALLARGDEVRVVDLESPADPRADWVCADVRDRAALGPALHEAETVFHLTAVISLAGGRGGLVESVNVAGVRAVAEAARAEGVRRLVHCSSVHAYDLEARVGAVVDEACPPATDRRLPVYDRSKAAGEAELLAVVADGLDAVLVNPTGIFGPRDAGPSRIGRMLLALWRRRLPLVTEGGFDWVDVRDVVAGLLAAAEHGRTGHRYLLPGHRHSVRELAELAAEVGGVPAPRGTVPFGCLRQVSTIATAVGRYWDNPLLPTADTLHALRTFPYVNGDKAAVELGHRPRPLRESLGDLHLSMSSLLRQAQPVT